MPASDKTYRIRTTVGRHNNDNNKEQCITVPMQQTYETLEIMSLKLDQTNSYKYYASDYGVIVGRVIANGGFGVPNAKISVFIEVNSEDSTQSRLLYKYISSIDAGTDGVRYNLLPDEVDSICHQPVGTFPNKRLVLDNKDEIEIFDKYWKYTTSTNQSGDYMLFGVPTGMQMLHMDLDLSDCGVLSQRPRDMVAQGYNIKQFESPNKFKQSKNLKSLPQIVSQDQGVYVHPYWGETTESGNTIAVTRCDIELEYKFEPTCVFIGSVITDKGSNAIGKNCTGDEKVGKMSELAAGEGMIEMIRKTIDNRVEECPIQGNRLIDGDGVWCYQIPMNLDYVTTDEFGNMVPTDNPNKGIPTRARVRFRMSLDESPDDNTGRKRCRYLVPNNPRLDDMNPVYNETHEVDYEFGSATREESYRDLFWNKVYTVKNYIPRLQKNRNITNRKHTGIKMTNHFGDNNPMPYNSLTVKLSFAFRLICIITKVIVYLISFLNMILGLIMTPFCIICNILRGLGKIPFVGLVFKLLSKPFCEMIISCIKLSSEFCDDGINKKTYYPGCWGCQKDETRRKHNNENNAAYNDNPEEVTEAEFPPMWGLEDSTLITCIENSLAQENESTSFNFVNDWINGTLYLPLWFRFIRPKRKFLFGLFTRKAKDQWCDATKPFNILKFQTCAVERGKEENVTSPYDGTSIPAYTKIKRSGDCGKKDKKCQETKTNTTVLSGLIVTKETMMGQTVYYYKPVEYDSIENEIVLLFATDIVLLGSLNDCDLDGIPQFFRNLEPSSFNQPSDILFTDTQIAINDSGEDTVLEFSSFTEATGADWGNLNSADECGKMGKDEDGGLFYGIGCASIEMIPKTVLNVPRLCEFGVSLDARKEIPNLSKLQGSDDDSSYDQLIPDGYVSFDEIFNHSGRSMFATLNGNRLRTRLNANNGLPEYDFRHYYVDNFDGGLRDIMQNRLQSCGSNISYKNNDKLERFCPDYYLFRMGEKPYFYNTLTDTSHRFPRFENSFYFYFGLKNGKTAIEKFNSQFFAPCETISGDELAVGIVTEPNDWCSEMSTNPADRNGYVLIDLTDIITPYDIIINSRDDASIGYDFSGITNDKIYFASETTVKDEKDKADAGINYHSKFEEYSSVVDGDYITLPNGEYELTITDGDGSIMSVNFSMNATKLSFSNSVIDFTTPNNQKEKEFANANSIITTGSLKDLNLEEMTSKTGGVIVITNINNPLASSSSWYRLTVKPKKDLQNTFASDYKGASMEFEMTINEKGYNIKEDDNSCSNPNWFQVVPMTFGEGAGSRDYIAIGVPYGDIEYEVTITELCDDLDSPNKATLSIKVSDPLPYKLFINDVDTEIFKTDNFSNGWTGITTASNARNAKVGPTEKNDVKYVTGWDKLATDWCAKVNGKDVGKYDWNKLPDYLSLKEEYEDAQERWRVIPNDEDHADEKEQALNEVNLLEREIIQYKLDYITTIKKTFWMTCPMEMKTFYPTLTTQEYPLTRQWAYDEEMIEGAVQDLHILVNPKGELSTTDGSDPTISDVAIPTITYRGNEMYGNWTDNMDPDEFYDMCFGYDRENEAYKRPYFIAGYNGKEEVLPEGLTVSDVDNANKLNNFFSFHLIDKVLRLNYISWAYIKDGHYFFKSDEIDSNEDKCGKQINMNGLLTGYVYNGLVNLDIEVANIENPQWKRISQPTFDTQTLGNAQLNIWTDNADESVDNPDGGLHHENDIPTKREIIFPEYMDINDINYPNYEKNERIIYHPVVNRNDTLTIEDSSCTQDETIYGKFNIQLIQGEDKSVAGKTDENGNTINSLSVKGRNGDSTATIFYYLVEFETDEGVRNYILNSADEFRNSKGDWDFRYPNDFNLNNEDSKYKFLAPDADLKTYVTDKIEGNVITEDEDGEEVEETFKGITTTGNFTGKMEKPYFVIGVANGKCRAFSPVYDFTPFKVNIVLVKSTGKILIYPGVLNNGRVDREYYISFFNYVPRGSIETGVETEKVLVNERGNEFNPTEGMVNRIGDVSELPKEGNNQEYFIKGTLYNVYYYKTDWDAPIPGTTNSETPPTVNGVQKDLCYMVDYVFDVNGVAQVGTIREVKKVEDKWEINDVTGTVDIDDISDLIIDKDFKVIINRTPIVEEDGIVTYSSEEYKNKPGWYERVDGQNPMIAPIIVDMNNKLKERIKDASLTEYSDIEESIKTNTSDFIIKDVLGLTHYCEVNSVKIR